jgi:hypothetical protein
LAAALGVLLVDVGAGVAGFGGSLAARETRHFELVGEHEFIRMERTA